MFLLADLDGAADGQPLPDSENAAATSGSSRMAERPRPATGAAITASNLMVAASKGDGKTEGGE